MRLHVGSTITLLALACAHGVVGRHAVLLGRQNNQDTTTTKASSASATSASSTGTTNDVVTSTTNTKVSQTNSAAVSSTISPTTTAASDVTSAITLSSAATSLATATPTISPGSLPLQPRITPALSIAGVILIAAGIALALIGIKHRWLHIFVSTAILTGLAVTVLIIYVMNPPVSDAVQGAYLVAAVVTGLISGAVSLIFKEVTEGLGCLLGGFCLAMWFLVLRPGGLIQSTTGCAIFIACLAVTGFGLSFSRYTRNYGLIGCTAFAGATITIIGIDCFSRAGMKEFWLYIWSLNSNAFPLGTTTFPITRGIRVEIAGVIIICLFGILSQLKIWKIVKERRARQDAEQAQDNEDKDQLESAVGRSIESKNVRDRAQWEAMYGDKNGIEFSQVQLDSGAGSSIDTDERSANEKRMSAGGKKMTANNRELDEIEMTENPSILSKRGSRTSFRQSINKRLSASGAAPKLLSMVAPSQEHLIDAHDWHTSELNTDIVSSIKEEPSRADMAPVIVPLPFTLPRRSEDEEMPLSDKGSVEVAQSVNDGRGVPLLQVSGDRGTEDYQLSIPHIDDERTYSLAGTADGTPDLDLITNPRWSMFPSSAPSPEEHEFDKDALLPRGYFSTDSRRASRVTLGEAPVEENDDEELVRPSVVQPEANTVPSAVSPDLKPSGASLVPDDDGDGNASVVGSLHRQNLPPAFSKVAQTYRTNEWAKHITDAEKPEVEHDPLSASPGIQVDPTFAAEAARPVPEEILHPISNEQEQTIRNTFDFGNVPQGNKTSRSAVHRAPSSGTSTPILVSQRSTSQASMSRPNDDRAKERSLSRLITRTSSVPISAQALVESPVEEHNATPVLRNASTPLGTASTVNLMDQREDRLKRRPTTGSFNALASTPNLHLTAPSEAASEVYAPSPSPVESAADEMTLAVRKAMMQQHQQRQTQQQQPPRSPSAARRDSSSRARRDSDSRQDPRTSRRTYNPAIEPSSRRNSETRPLSRKNSASQALSPSSQNLIYDSHQPRRSAAVDPAKQTALLSQWRQSLDNTNKPQPFTLSQPGPSQHSAGRADLQRQVELRREYLEREREKRESKRDEVMRSGVLHEAHRDKLRKMQAGISEGAKH